MLIYTYGMFEYAIILAFLPICVVSLVLVRRWNRRRMARLE